MGRVDSVSTHAPARGQSAILMLSPKIFSCFNSCPREGAILSGRRSEPDVLSFNSCPREGAIPPRRRPISYFGKFQLMPPRGGNHRRRIKVCVGHNVSTHAPARGQSRLAVVFQADFQSFNSCPREGAIAPGCDLPEDDNYVSTHAPARGQSILGSILGLGIYVSTHAPARGQSQSEIVGCKSNIVSTHAPARGQS